MSRFMAGVAAACSLVALPAAAADDDVCGPRASILDTLSRDYQESPAAMGVASGGSVIEVFTARSGKTWTILLTHPDGNSCIVAAGEQWTPVLRQLSSTDNEI